MANYDPRFSMSKYIERTKKGLRFEFASPVWLRRNWQLTFSEGNGTEILLISLSWRRYLSPSRTSAWKIFSLQNDLKWKYAEYIREPYRALLAAYHIVSNHKNLTAPSSFQSPSCTIIMAYPASSALYARPACVHKVSSIWRPCCWIRLSPAVGLMKFSSPQIDKTNTQTKGIYIRVSALAYKYIDPICYACRFIVQTCCIRIHD